MDAAGREIDLSTLSYSTEHFDEEFVTSPQVYELIQQTCPEYDASGYLGGTVLHTSLKWLLGVQIGSKHGIYGSIGKRTMELGQTFHHIFNGTYLAYLSNSRIGRKVFLLAPWDKPVRAARNKWLSHVVRRPGALFESIYLQSIGIIQAPDTLPDGRADMCDSCPDMTYWNGKLINSCRMDEYRLYGGMLSVLDRAKVQPPSD